MEDEPLGPPEETGGRATEFLFPHVERFAHGIVQYTIQLVEQFEVSLEDYVQDGHQDRNKVENIIDLLFYFTAKNERDPASSGKRKVFRYFAAAAIYSQIMMASFEKSQGNKLPSERQWCFPEVLIDIFYLDKIAKQIKKGLTDFSFVKREMDKKEVSGMTANSKLREYHLSRLGPLTSNECIGNTPFLIVYKGRRREVSIRRGFELYRPELHESEEVTEIDMKLSKFPVRVSLNGVHFDNSVEEESLQSLVGNDEGLAIKLFKGKHITEIHIKVTDGLRYSYNIDMIDHKLEGDIDAREKEREDLEKLTGRQYGKGYESCCFQEDLFVTVFAHLLFSGSESYDQHQLQAFEYWSLEKIRDFTKNPEQSKMYIGFCFGTLLDVGHNQALGATGSRNTLLLALTRGFIKLYGNLRYQEKHEDPESKEDSGNKRRRTSIKQENNNADSAVYNESKFKKFIDSIQVPYVMKGFKIVKKYGKRLIEVQFDREELPQESPKVGMLVRRVKNRKIAYDNGIYLGSTAKGIVVKIERSPMRLIFVWTLVGLGIFGFPYMYWPSTSESKEWREFFRSIGSILELCGALIALGFLAVKTMFRQWTLTDMFDNRKGCQSFSELIKVIKYTEKRTLFKSLLKKNGSQKIKTRHEEKIGREPEEIFNRFKWNMENRRLEKRRKAIEVCATLPNPRLIFSYHNSCAFVATG